MKKIVSFFLSLTMILSVCVVSASAVQLKSIAPQYELSEELYNYYYEDALSRAIQTNYGNFARKANHTTYINGGIKIYGDDFIQQTVIEVQSASLKSSSVGVIAARATDYWYRFELVGHGDLMATVQADCQFLVTHGVSVVQNGHEAFYSYIEPNYENGDLFVNEGAYSWTVSANKHTCTFKYKYNVDYNGYIHAKTITITCDYNANVTSSDNEYEI